MKNIVRLSFIMILTILGCKKDDIKSPITDTGELPLLNSGNKIGTIIGFNVSNPPSTIDSIQIKWNEAINTGMSIGRLQTSWRELEPQPNVYDKDVLKNKLVDFNAQGLQTFLLISAYDSGGPELPSDLADLKFDDEILIKRFNKLMDWVIPMLAENNGYIISITNEADNDFGDVPNLHNEILSFLKEAKNHIHTINEDMAVTITIAEGSLDANKPGIEPILAECDVACWNFYGSKFNFGSPYFISQTESEIKADIERMLKVSGKKNIVIQELGMYTGSDHLDGSEEIQRKFFELFFQAMKYEPRIRAAYVFQMVDWSPETTEIFLQGFKDEGLPQDFIDTFAESLETVGLIGYGDGKEKLAWGEFTKWLKEFK